MARTQPTKRTRKLLSSSDHQLLGVKEVLDSLLVEAENLPKQVKEILVSARDQSWQAFLAEQEKIHQSTR